MKATINGFGRMTREEFLKRRKSGIGGSDVAAVLGLSKWRSPLDVWEDKTSPLDVRELPPEATPNGNDRALYWGRVLEEEVARAYSIVTGRKVCRYNRMLRDPEREWMIGDVDRLAYTEAGRRPFNFKTGEIVTDRGVECKTARFKSEEWGDEGTDNVPLPYYIQVQWYMALCPTIKRFDIPVLFGGSDFQIFTVERDPATIAKITDAAERFWLDNVLGNVPPSPRSFEEVKKLDPVASIPRITASAELEAAVRGLWCATAKRREAEKAEAELKFEVAAAMGSAELAELPDGTPLCTFKNTKNGDRRLVVKIQN